MKRAAAYVRVSTEEQVMNGYSIDAQREALRAYAKEHGYLIIREYADEGVSGKQPYNKRPALSQFMDDLQAGEKFDVLLFCKLDRFYRSVKLYYQAVEVLDRYGVAWKAILENYETETANGRFTVNIMLSVAENEADRTSERIKFVFADKLRRKEVITGSAPLGYLIEDHKFVIDPEKVEIVRAIFREYAAGASAASVARYLAMRYSLTMTAAGIIHLLSNPLYTGVYRGVPDFCEPIIPASEYRAVQERKEKRGVRRNQSHQVYIFSGLLTCSICGKRLSGCRRIHKAETPVCYVYYRCNTVFDKPGHCTRKRRLREENAEKWLLENIKTELENQRIEAEVQAQAPEPKPKEPDRAAIRRKLARLKDLYVNELIDLGQYKEDYDRYTAQLAEIDAAVVREKTARMPDFKALSERVTGIESFYRELTAEERQEFWRGLLREIRVEPDNTLHIFFR